MKLQIQSYNMQKHPKVKRTANFSAAGSAIVALEKDQREQDIFQTLLNISS